MIAPLYDNKGTVRYFIGCQIDVSHLIEGGRGLDSFEKLLAQYRANNRYGEGAKKRPETALIELSELLSAEEMETVKKHGRSNSGSSGRETPIRPSTQRKYIGMDDPAEKNMWPSPQYGPSGRLPGVYQNVSALTRPSRPRPLA